MLTSATIAGAYAPDGHAATARSSARDANELTPPDPHGGQLPAGPGPVVEVDGHRILALTYAGVFSRYQPAAATLWNGIGPSPPDCQAIYRQGMLKSAQVVQSCDDARTRVRTWFLQGSTGELPSGISGDVCADGYLPSPRWASVAGKSAVLEGSGTCAGSVGIFAWGEAVCGHGDAARSASALVDTTGPGAELWAPRFWAFRSRLDDAGGSIPLPARRCGVPASEVSGPEPAAGAAQPFGAGTPRRDVDFQRSAVAGARPSRRVGSWVAGATTAWIGYYSDCSLLIPRTVHAELFPYQAALDFDHVRSWDGGSQQAMRDVLYGRGAFNPALEADPSVHFWRAVLQGALGRSDLMRAEFSQAVALPDDPIVTARVHHLEDWIAAGGRLDCPVQMLEGEPPYEVR